MLTLFAIMLKNDNLIYNAEKAKKYRLRTKQLVFNHYGNGNPKCVYCFESELSMLTIGHINDDGVEDRKKTGMGSSFYSWLKVNNFPDNGYEISCFNCNCAKRINPNAKSKRKFYISSNTLYDNYIVMLK